MSTWALRSSRCRCRSWLCHCGMCVLGREASPPCPCLLAAVQDHRVRCHRGSLEMGSGVWPLGYGSAQGMQHGFWSPS